MKIKELRKKKIADLHKLLKASREELRSFRFSISSEQEKNVRKMREVKKTIAKVLTILNTKQKSEKEETGDQNLNNEIKQEDNKKSEE